MTTAAAARSAARPGSEPSVQLSLTSDQEFFRDTTAKFLTEHAAPAEIRRLRDEPDGFDARYWRQGAELGWTSLLVDRGARRRIDQRRRPRRPRPGGRRVRAPRRPGPAGADQHRGRRPQRRWRPTATPTSWPACWPGRRSPRGATWSPGRTTGSTTSPSRSGSTVPTSCCNGTKRPVESAGRASHLLVTGRTGAGLTQVLVPTGDRGRHGAAHAHHRPDPSVLRGHLRGRAGTGRRRARRDRRGGRPDRAPVPPGGGPGQRRDGRRHAVRPRHDPRVGVRPVLLRPPPRLLPGAEAPLRRHEDLARGRARHQRRWPPRP